MYTILNKREELHLLKVTIYANTLTFKCNQFFRFVSKLTYVDIRCLKFILIIDFAPDELML